MFNRALVDDDTRDQLVALMMQESSRNVVRHHFQEVFWKLLVESYPLEESFRWRTHGQPIPPDLHERRDYYFDARQLLYWFWMCLCEPSLYGAPRERLPDGPQRTELDKKHLKCLTRLPFEIAINTWFWTCVEWLQICNIDWYYEDVRQWPGQIKLWQPGEERQIPGYLAGAMALEYF